jgi:hypothetical protein
VEISGALDDAKEPAESISTLSYATALHVTAERTMSLRTPDNRGADLSSGAFRLV